MSDYAHVATDKQILKLERKLRKLYTQTIADIDKKISNYLQQFTEEDKKRREAIANITGKAEKQAAKQKYLQWKMQKITNNQRWAELRDNLSADLLDVNRVATQMINDSTPEVYALNHNYATYQAETGAGASTSYALYDKDTVRHLLEDNPYLYARSELSSVKDLMYNQKNIQSVLLQSIMQGKAIPDIAEALATACGWSNFNVATRNARTFMTNAQNAGRYDGYKRAEKKGIKLSLVWAATLDGRTRHEHRQLDGQRRKVGEPFEVDGVKIMYPADFGGGDYKVPADMIYNCRCTIVAQIQGYEYGIATSSPKLKGMSYEEWKEELSNGR